MTYRLIFAPAMLGLALAALPARAAVAQVPEKTATAKIDVISLFVAEPQSETVISIRVGPPDALPKNAFVRIRGLPGTVTLSDGHMVAAGVWAVPLFGLANLRALIPTGVSGRSELAVSLIGVDGAILAEARTALVVAQVGLRSFVERPAIAAVPPLAPPVPAGKPDRTVKADLLIGQKPSAPAPSALVQVPNAPPVLSLVAPDPVLPAAPKMAAAALPAPVVAAPPVVPPPVVLTPAVPAPAVPAPATVVPPAAPASALSDEAVMRCEKLVQSGDRALAQGNVSTARQYFLRAADMGFGPAAFKLGETYDATELVRLQVSGLTGDAKEARRWYLRAQELGEKTAEARLKRLGS